MNFLRTADGDLMPCVFCERRGILVVEIHEPELMVWADAEDVFDGAWYVRVDLECARCGRRFTAIKRFERA